MRYDRNGWVCRPAPGTYTNEFLVGVEEVVFQGDHLLLRTTVCEDPDFVVKIPNTVGQGAVLAGDLVRIGWTKVDCRALEPDGDDAVGR